MIIIISIILLTTETEFCTLTIFAVWIFSSNNLAKFGQMKNNFIYTLAKSWRCDELVVYFSCIEKSTENSNVYLSTTSPFSLPLYISLSVSLSLSLYLPSNYNRSRAVVPLCLNRRKLHRYTELALYKFGAYVHGKRLRMPPQGPAGKQRGSQLSSPLNAWDTCFHEVDS